LLFASKHNSNLKITSYLYANYTTIYIREQDINLLEILGIERNVPLLEKALSIDLKVMSEMKCINRPKRKTPANKEAIWLNVVMIKSLMKARMGILVE
jgi:hypothetical protein